MRIERAPDLPEDAGEAVDANGNVLARLTLESDRAPARTAVLRFSSAAFDRIIEALKAIERRKPGSL